MLRKKCILYFDEILQIRFLEIRAQIQTGSNCDLRICQNQDSKQIGMSHQKSDSSATNFYCDNKSIQSIML